MQPGAGRLIGKSWYNSIRNFSIGLKGETQVNTGTSYSSNSAEFHHVGAVQQHSTALIWFGRLLDGAIIFLAFYVVSRYQGALWDANHLVVALGFVVLFDMTTSFFEMHHSWRMVRLRHELMKLSGYWLLSSVFLISVLYVLNGTVSVEKHTVYVWLAVSFVLVCSARVAVRLILRYARAAGFDCRRVAFFGATDVTKNLVNIFETHPWMGMNVIGVFDDPGVGDTQKLAIPVKTLTGDLENLTRMTRDGEVDIVYISLPLSDEIRVRKIVDQFSDSTVSIYYCPGVFNFELINSRWDNVFGQPVISLVDSPFIGYRGRLKSMEDTLLLLLLGPFVLIALAVFSIAILVSSGRPIFFKQSRYGLDGKKFTMWKFRTMYQASCKEQYAQVRKNDQRITKLGAVLRKTSLDELPQFINVLKGEMSVVGPRPHPDVVNEEMRKIIHRYMFRHKIKPGITGLAQVSGCRGETETIDCMQRRLKYDLQYIKSWSLWLDIRILFRTLHELAGKHVY